MLEPADGVIILSSPPPATLVSRGIKCARTDEMVKPPSMGMQLGPIVKDKIDDREPGDAAPRRSNMGKLYRICLATIENYVRRRLSTPCRSLARSSQPSASRDTGHLTWHG